MPLFAGHWFSRLRIKAVPELGLGVRDGMSCRHDSISETSVDFNGSSKDGAGHMNVQSRLPPDLAPC